MRLLLLILLLGLCNQVSAQRVVTMLPDSDASIISETVPVDAPVKFSCNYGRFPNTGDSQFNHTVVCGWNAAAGGGAAVSGEPSFFMSWESHWKPSTTINDWSEWHLNHTNRAGVVTRPFSITADNTTGSSVINFRTDNLNFVSGSKTLMQMTPAGFILNDNAYIRSVNSGVPIIQQMNGAGTIMTPLIYLDTTDAVRLGGPVKIGGVKVLGTQCPAIPDSDGSSTDDTRAINAILVCLRSHGLVGN